MVVLKEKRGLGGQKNLAARRDDSSGARERRAQVREKNLLVGGESL